MKENWPRWIRASILKTLQDFATTNNIHYFTEGLTRFTQNQEKYIEVRISGPSITELSKNYFLLIVNLNVVWTVKQDYQLYTCEVIKGLLLDVMREFCIYEYGDGEALLGTLTTNSIEVRDFGLIIPESQIYQGSLEGSYRMWLGV